MKFLSAVQAESLDAADLEELRSTVAMDALLPLSLKDETFQNAFDLTNALTGRTLQSALSAICVAAADKNKIDVIVRAID